MNRFKWGALCWTGCGAAWAVMAGVFDRPDMAVLAVACLIMARVFNEWPPEDD